MRTDIPIPTTIDETTTLGELQSLIDAYDLSIMAMPYAHGRVVVTVAGGGQGRVGNAERLAVALALALRAWTTATCDALSPEPEAHVLVDEPERKRKPTAPLRMRAAPSPSPLPDPPRVNRRREATDLLDLSGDYVMPFDKLDGSEPIEPPEPEPRDSYEELTDAEPIG